MDLRGAEHQVGERQRKQRPHLLARPVVARLAKTGALEKGSACARDIGRSSTAIATMEPQNSSIKLIEDQAERPNAGLVKVRKIGMGSVY